MDESFLSGRVALHPGDCRAVLAELESNLIDSVVTDPPYALAFMGKAWDHAAVAFDPDTWRAVYRVLKPGGHLLAMGGTRTFHRLACAIEDAGFEIRDTISWLYGSGFPKSHDVSKGIDRAAGVERGEERPHPTNQCKGGQWCDCMTLEPSGRFSPTKHPAATEPATDAAREWQGWGTALKPACELIVLARKPLSEGTVAANVLRWGTGAINVDGCRVGTETTIRTSNAGTNGDGWGMGKSSHVNGSDGGRWPANVAHDGSAEVTAAFPDSESVASNRGDLVDFRGDNFNRADGKRIDGSDSVRGHNDSGSAARFFYTSKADADDRLGSKHPTVKPLDLMQWLVRLVTPRGGTVLDPFAGTGTAGEAAWREGAHAVLIEAEPEYQADIRRRMALVLAGPDERTRQSIKAKNLPVDYGPLFGLKQVLDEMPVEQRRRERE